MSCYLVEFVLLLPANSGINAAWVHIAVVTNADQGDDSMTTLSDIL